MIEKMIELIKFNRIVHQIDYSNNVCLIILSTGTLCVFLQFEKSTDDLDFNYLTTWISEAPDDFIDSPEIDLNTYEGVLIDQLENILDEYLEKVGNINKIYGNLSNKFRDIEKVVNENDIPKNLVDKLYNELEIDNW